MVTARSSAPVGMLITTLLVGAMSGCTPKPDKLTDVAAPITSPGWIRFRPEAQVDARSFMSRYGSSLQLAEGTKMRPVSEQTDELGMTHLRYQQYYRGIEVEGAQFLVHAKGTRALSANGELALRFAPSVLQPSIDEARAWAIARDHLHADAYYDGERLVEALKAEPSNHVPRGTLLFTPQGPELERVLAWRFDAYVEPVARSRRLYVDAGTGAIIKEAPLLPNCFTTNAPTSYRGNQTFNTARATIPVFGERFILADDCHGNQLRLQSFNFTSGSSKDVFDSDNNWSDQDRGLATPVGAGEWSNVGRPTLSIADLSLFGVGDVDYFRITLPDTAMVGGECFPSGVALSFSAPVDARILVGTNTVQSGHNVSYLKLGGTSGTFVLQVSSPFPSLILDYNIRAAFYQSIDPNCWQTEPPTVFEQILDCPMCDVGVLSGRDELILDPDYRRPDLVSPLQHYFRFRGGDMEIPIDVTRGNALQVELVDSNGRMVQRSTWSAGSEAGPAVKVTGLPEGIYSLRFSGYGNGTQIQLQAPD
ncbi:hypothetical protein NVV94_13865 [Pseudomonas sp. LS1212]|uniref:hypothetical protein n=1 Tax=Pseudomonas sp. LS1212 TaxID=2972478 RepID=UPI00215CD520|nr:hypothetical protein [Pseudomonas sp. LS1212]UVJ41802.1 hypothetical protein NVV94_13865 [Pseudomonas sp. LS1212]